MKSLKIEATHSTPEINFDIENNILSISKVSKPENASEFYKPVFELINNYEKAKVESKIERELVINLKFEYFNTATTKVLYDLIIKLKDINEQGVKVIINWYYYSDDEDLLEEGEIISEALDVPFNYIPVEHKSEKN
ncbi:MAG: DUF1987 domain-containing protein [Bacteroidales bacterium]|jgi:hypothetical protein|nr:DUF1987 domain-containing protein [Bacteroidales bacterium]